MLCKPTMGHGPVGILHFALLNPCTALRVAQYPVFTDAHLNLSRSHSSTVEGPYVFDTKAALTSVGGDRGREQSAESG